MNNKRLGLILACLDMVTFGLLPILSHYFVATIDPILFAGAATFFGSVPLVIWLQKKNCLNQLYSKKYLPSLLSIAVLTTAASIFYFVGTKLTSGLNTGLLTQIEPFYALLLGIIVLRETISTNQILATLTMVAGAVIIIYQGAARLNLGDILVCLSPLLIQLSHLFAKKVYARKADSNIVPTARLLFSGILLLGIVLITNPGAFSQLANLKTLITLILFGLIFRCLDFILWYQAIARISVSRASAVIPLAIAISFLGSVFFLKETVSNYQWLGLFFILGGLIWLSKIHQNEI